MSNFNLDDIYDSLNLLGLPKKVSINDIKAAYRKKSLQYHPDKCSDDKHKKNEMIAKLSSAYKLLMKFFEEYEIDLSELEFNKEKEIKYRQKFYDNFFDMNKD